MNQQLKENNYLIIPKFIDGARARAYAAGFRDFANNTNLRGDYQVENSQSSYNYLPFLKLVVEKIDEASAYAGETLVPICSYSRVYKHGNVLKRHRDRPGCEFSLTLNLDGDTDWAIWVQKPSGEEVAVNLTPGDAVMYLGHAADHWRTSYTGQEYVQVFLHYVNSQGPFKDEHNEFLTYTAKHPLTM